MHPAEALKVRTQVFAEAILRFWRELAPGRIPERVRSQLAGSGTAIGANYRAACRAKSHADYTSKVATVLEEADETVYWLEVLVNSGCLTPAEVAWHRNEAAELVAIFAASYKTARENERRRRQQERP